MLFIEGDLGYKRGRETLAGLILKTPLPLASSLKMTDN